MVIIVSGNQTEKIKNSDEVIIQKLKFYLSLGVTKKVAIEIAVEELKEPKNRVYKLAQNI